jgi:tetratricopeptide (TPR) repeat protein
MGLGRCYREAGSLDEAQKHHEGCLEISRSIQGRHVEGLSLLSLGEVARDRADFSGARGLYERSLQVCRGIGAQQAVAEAALAYGRFLLDQNEQEAALPFIEEADQISDNLAIHIMPGPLPGAYLALVGRRDPASVVIPDTAPAACRAEAHLVLYCADHDTNHLNTGAALIQQISTTIPASQRDRFWSTNPSARMLRDLQGS